MWGGPPARGARARRSRAGRPRRRRARRATAGGRASGRAASRHETHRGARSQRIRARGILARLPNPSDARAPRERILVTGANGHLGRRLLERVAREPGGRRARARAGALAGRGGGARARCRPACVPRSWSSTTPTPRRWRARPRAARPPCTWWASCARRAAAATRDAHEATTRALAAAAPRAGLRRIVYLSILGSHANAANACLASKGRAEDILLAGATPALVLRVPMVIGAGDFVSRTLRNQARARVRAAAARGQGARAADRRRRRRRRDPRRASSARRRPRGARPGRPGVARAPRAAARARRACGATVRS